ncbi:hypothetical protein Ancab_012963 [Ancistrocladus abbreviatus]
MDQIASAHEGSEVDLESGGVTTERGLSEEIVVSSAMETSGLGCCRGLLDCEARVSSSISSPCSDGCLENVRVDKKAGVENDGDGLEKKVVKKKPKAISAKKPPKPPRPPRGLSLDSADQRLIRELAELAKLKRARIARMKALKKTRDAKGASSKNQLLATLFTVIFCFVLLFQGISSRSSSAARSHAPSEVAGGGLFSTQFYTNISASNTHGPGSESPRMKDLTPMRGEA